MSLTWSAKAAADPFFNSAGYYYQTHNGVPLGGKVYYPSLNYCPHYDPAADTWASGLPITPPSGTSLPFGTAYVAVSDRIYCGPPAVSSGSAYGELTWVKPDGTQGYAPLGSYNSAPQPAPGCLDTSGTVLWTFANNVAQSCDLSTFAWTVHPTGTLSGSFSSGSLAVAGPDGLFYIFEGQAGSGRMAAYNPATNVWTWKASRPASLFSSAMAVANGIIYCIGGYLTTGGGPQSTVYSYNPATNAWTTETPLPIPLGAAAACYEPITSKLIVAAGYTSGSTANNTAFTAPVNAAPNAPTLLSPITGSIDYTVAQTFTGSFTDPTPGDTLTAIEIQYRTGTGAWSTTGKITTAAASNTFAANFFTSYAGHTLEWQMRTWDSADQVGPWSGSAYVAVVTAPATPFKFVPAPSIQSETPTVAGGRTVATDPITSYQFQIVSDSAGAPGSTVYSDTGVVTPIGGPVTSVSALMPVPSPPMVNGGHYHVLGRIAYPAGIWQHGWTDSGVLTAVIVGPLQPVLTYTIDPTTLKVTLTVTNPASDPHPPVRNDIYRVDPRDGSIVLACANVPLNGSAVDALAWTNRPIQYFARASAAGGAYTDSA